MMPLSNVSRHAGKEAPAVLGKLSEGQFQGNLTAALVHPEQLNRFRRNNLLAWRSRWIIGKQHGQSLSQEFLAGMTEHFLGGAIDEKHPACFVNRDDCV